MRYLNFVLLLFLLVGAHIQANSQDVEPGAYRIKLGSPIATKALATNKGSSRKIEIVLNTEDTLSFGHVPLRQGNGTMRLVGSSKTPSEWLSTYANQRFMQDFIEEGLQLKWLFQTLSISSDTGGRSVFTHVEAAIYHKKMNDKTFSLAARIDTLLLRENGDSLSYDDALADVVDMMHTASKGPLSSIENHNINSITGFNRALNGMGIIGKPMSLPRILLDSSYTKGIYRSYTEFLNNEPSIRGAIWLVPDSLAGNGCVTIYRLGGDSSAVLVNNVWGICMGGNEVYKLEGKFLLPIEKSGNGFILSRYQDYVIRKNQANVWRAVMYKAWKDDNNPYERKRSLVLKKLKGRLLPARIDPIATKIDMATGELSL